jgi:Flp pilus assembly protein TadG
MCCNDSSKRTIRRAKNCGAISGSQSGCRLGRLRAESGQSMLEVVIITPLLLLLLAGVIEMGRYAYIGILVGSAARAGAAYGGKNPGDTAGIVNAACNDFFGPGGSSSPQLGSTPAANCGTGSGTNYMSITSSLSCGCDNGGSVGTLYGGACNDVPNTLPTDPIPACQSGGGTWAAMVSVTASGTFTALFSMPGIPSSLTITRTAEVRVTP